MMLRTTVRDESELRMNQVMFYPSTVVKVYYRFTVDDCVTLYHRPYQLPKMQNELVYRNKTKNETKVYPHHRPLLFDFDSVLIRDVGHLITRHPKIAKWLDKQEFQSGNPFVSLLLARMSIWIPRVNDWIWVEGKIDSPEYGEHTVSFSNNILLEAIHRRSKNSFSYLETLAISWIDMTVSDYRHELMDLAITKYIEAQRE